MKKRFVSTYCVTLAVTSQLVSLCIQKKSALSKVSVCLSLNQPVEFVLLLKNYKWNHTNKADKKVNELHG